MRNWLIALLVCIAGVVHAQDWAAQACVILLTNASNSASTWVNDGTAAEDFGQDIATRQPTNFGTYYAFGVSNVMTSVVTCASETNIIALSVWCRNFNPGASPGALVFGTWGGSGARGGIMMMYDSGTVYLGVRIPDNYFYTALSDTVNFHHLFVSYDHTRTNEVLAYVDGVKLTTHAGTYGVSRTATNNVMAIGSGTEMETFYGYAKLFVSDAKVFTNYTGDLNTLATNIYAFGRNSNDPPVTAVAASAIASIEGFHSALMY